LDQPANQATLTVPPEGTLLGRSAVHSPPEVHVAPGTPTIQLEVFADDEILPVFEAALDLPRSLAPTPTPVNGASTTEEADD